MLLIRHVYNVLLVSSAGKLNTALLPFFDAERFEPVTVVDTVSRAQRMLAERDYDLVIINAPLPDDFGRRFAIDVCTDSGRVALLIVRSDIYDETCSAMTPHGVLVAKRPMERSVMEELLDVMCTVRERLRGVQKKTMTLEDKMAEIRQVNRAKWALIRACHMTEEEAHRYIQKQAMDLCVSKKEAAESILKTYG
jgi:response regulator NasT